MTVSEARAALPDVLERVENGDDVVITRHGTAVAVVVRPDVLRVRRAAGALADAERIGRAPDVGRSTVLPRGSGPSSERAEELEDTGSVGIGSVLLLPEVLATPLRDAADDELAALAALLGRLDLRPVDLHTAQLATALASSHRLRAADAVHLATAVAAGATGSSRGTGRTSARRSPRST